MKKRLTLILFFLLMLSINIVYAKSNSVIVSNVVVKEKSGNVSVSDPSFSNDKINSNILFNKLNDSVTFEIDLKNNDNSNFSISKIEDTNKNDNISIEYDYDKDIEKKETAKFRIKITYTNQLINQEEIDIKDFEVDITIVSSNSNPEKIIINPQTGDGISIYYIIFIVAFLIILLLSNKKIFKNKIITNILILVIGFILPMAVIASQKLNIKIKFDTMVVKGEFEKFNIKFDSNNGDDKIITVGTYGKPIGKLPDNPSKEGYVFDKWVDESGNEITKDTIITKEMKINAKYNVINYNITYDLDGGIVNGNPTSYNIETDSFTLNNPTKLGFTFAGWTGSNDSELQTSVTINKGTTGDKSYKANYSVNRSVDYKVIHRYQNIDLTSYTEEIEELSGPFDTTVKPEVKGKIGFVSPQEETLLIKEDGTSELVYEYQREKYQLSYKDTTYVDLDNSSHPGEYVYGEIIIIKALDKTGYTHTGWSDGTETLVYNKNISSDLNIEPSFTPNTNTKYVVIHKQMSTDGLTYAEVSNETLYGTTDTLVTPPTNTYLGFTSPDAQTILIKGDGTAEVTYLYKRNKYSISYMDDDNLITKNNFYYQEDISVIDNPTKEGYTFTGWDNSIPEKMPAENIVVSADWTINSYTITFNTDGGNVIPPITQNYDTDITSPANPTKEGYTFAGWSSEIPSKMPAHDMTITASWTINSYTITFNTDGGTVIPPITQNYDTDITSPANPTKEGYTFAGWSSEIPSMMPAHDITITASWTINSYTITFNTDGGTVIPSITQNYDTDITSPANPTKQGYTFIGWDTEIPSKMPAHDMTITAQWEEDITDIVCKRATMLHHETCNNTSSSQGCRADGYALGDPIVYGKIITSNTLESGHALDCDVDGTGYNQRFYYVRSLNGNAVLISNMNFEGDNGQGINASYIYPDSLDKLPRKADQWTNLPINFGDYAARFITIDDLMAMTNSTTLEDLTEHSGVLGNKYNYIFENTSYANVATPEYRSTVWIKEDNGNRYRYHKNERKVVALDSSNYNTSKNAVRPVIEVPIEKIDYKIGENQVTLMFDSLGGTLFDTRLYEKGSTVSDLPTPTRDNYTFHGWFTDSGFSNEFNNGDTIDDNTILYAKWIKDDSVVEYNNTGYSSFASAISKIPNNTKSVIKLLKDTTEKVSIASSKDIEIDLNGHTITNNDDNQVISNSGILKVKNGTLTTTAETKAAFDNNNSGEAILENVTIYANGSRSAVYNEKGLVIIDGGSVLSTTNDLRPTVMNTSSSCELRIYDATITSNAKNAVSNKSGTLIIGKQGGILNASTPVIIGGSYGVVSNNNVQMYDGIIKGKIAPVLNGTANTGNTEITYTGTATNNIVTASETGFEKHEDVDGDYSTLSLVAQAGKYVINFNANGGTVSPLSILINQGDTIPTGDIPVPENGIYHFDGWYTTDALNTLVDFTIPPVESTTYYAKWSYSANNEIVNFNTTNDAMSAYYSNISSWITNESSFQTNMDGSFNSFNCSACTGPKYQDCPAPEAGKTLCDQPLGYDTGITDGIKVYLSDEVNKSKGAEVSYVTITNDGKIYNMIPGEVYYWESISDANVYGLVKVTNAKRNIYSSVRNVRDLGGMNVVVGDKTGTLKYGILFRGSKLSSNASDANELSKLGIDEELDLRSASDDKDTHVGTYKNKEIINYVFDTYSATSRSDFRDAITMAMQDVVNGKHIYFHCKIGTDRTGTLAYFLEGLLGVIEEDKLQDYELSYFYGLLNRHRFHDYLQDSSFNPRFRTMSTTYDTNKKIYDWYIDDPDNQTADINLVNDFRDAMINYNN